jgi:hypothetical protein
VGHLDLAVGVLVDGQGVDHRTVSLSHSRSSSSMISPLKLGG